MRFRNIATTAAGAVTAGVLVFSSLSTAAVAAPAGGANVVAAAAVEVAGSPLTVSYFGQTISYDPKFAVTQLDQALTIKQAAFPAIAGPPDSVVVNKAAVEAVFVDAQGKEVTAKGETNQWFKATALNKGFTPPSLVLDLPFGSSAGQLTLKSYKMVLTVGTSPSTLNFTVGTPAFSFSHTAVSNPALLAKYSTYALGVGDKFNVTQDDTNLSLTIADFPKIAGIPAMVTVSAVELNAVFTLGDKEIPFTGKSVIDPATPMANGFSFPAIVGKLPAGTPAGELKLKTISAIVTAAGSPTDIAIDILRPLTVAFSATKDEVKEEPAPAPAPIPAGHTAFDCTGSFGPMTYTTELKPVVKRNGDNVDISFALGSMAGVVPVPVSADMVAELGLTVNGAAVTAVGEGKGTQISPNQPIALPAVAASVKTDATKIDIKATSMKIKVANFAMEFPCTLAAPAEVGSFTVDAKAVAPAPKAKSTKATVKSVKVAKKSKKATIKVAVKAGKANASGKVTIVVKNAKGKVVAKKTVTLKKGAASFKTKKLKAGKYKATVSFKATKAFKKSASKAKSFRVKK